MVWCKSQNPKRCYLPGLRLNPPRGNHILCTGSQCGSVKETQLVFLAKKGMADFHEEMNVASFELWFIKQLLPNIPAESAIVLDNAPFHSRKVEKVPNTKTKKGEIKKWREEKNINFPDESLKKEMLDEVNKVKHLYNKYYVDENAKDPGFTVLRLAPTTTVNSTQLN